MNKGKGNWVTETIGKQFNKPFPKLRMTRTIFYQWGKFARKIIIKNQLKNFLNCNLNTNLDKMTKMKPFCSLSFKTLHFVCFSDPLRLQRPRALKWSKQENKQKRTWLKIKLNSTSSILKKKKSSVKQISSWEHASKQDVKCSINKVIVNPLRQTWPPNEQEVSPSNHRPNFLRYRTRGKTTSATKNG